jgi:D-alanine-D-alanine ligase
LPCFVKPSNMGSSVGVSKAHDAAELEAALTLALEYDEWVVAEEMVTGREIEVAILGDDPPDASLPGEIVPGAEFYDYADKYEDGAAKLLAPAPLGAAETAEVARSRCGRSSRVGARRWRVDFFYTDHGFVVNELNTIPVHADLDVPRLWEVSGCRTSSCSTG